MKKKKKAVVDLKRRGYFGSAKTFKIWQLDNFIRGGYRLRVKRNCIVLYQFS